MKSLAIRILNSVGIGVFSQARAEMLLNIEQDSWELTELALNNLGLSSVGRGQLKQDLFVLIETGFKRDGFFVEFGATNGVDLSNTWLLEKEYGWTGILAEPASVWHKELVQNRDAVIEEKCVWSRSGERVQFNIADEGEYSTIDGFGKSDKNDKHRISRNVQSVETISLQDLLLKHSAPKKIDYLSVDTEGSEYEILQAFDFSQFSFGVITVEHNFTEARQKIHSLLSSKGYTRRFDGLSRWDDWYTKR